MTSFSDTCARCGADLRKTSSIMSRFNTDTICGDCKAIEKVHPNYPRAHGEELAAVKAGNTNYPGIGGDHCPELYKPPCGAERFAIAATGKPKSRCSTWPSKWGPSTAKTVTRRPTVSCSTTDRWR